MFQFDLWPYPISLTNIYFGYNQFSMPHAQNNASLQHCKTRHLVDYRYNLNTKTCLKVHLHHRASHIAPFHLQTAHNSTMTYNRINIKAICH